MKIFLRLKADMICRIEIVDIFEIATFRKCKWVCLEKTCEGIWGENRCVSPKIRKLCVIAIRNNDRGRLMKGQFWSYNTMKSDFGNWNNIWGLFWSAPTYCSSNNYIILQVLEDRTRFSPFLFLQSPVFCFLLTSIVLCILCVMTYIYIYGKK